MAKQSFNQVLCTLVASQGITANEALTERIDHKIDLTRLKKEAKIIRNAYKATLDQYFNGDKKLFDKASEAWHNLGIVIQVVETIESQQSINRSIWK
ncbi:hypothetical protein [Providencia phage PSTCR5]|uniref:Uncharacterized protein n=1 Tax=Providencia phage PSTCR5 TaxID=2783547 RepID=A0A873WX27_9CAUD|nr:hypothetical protein KNV68_gp059 [Providencia phage PSTCR5]QPB12157.1 hypothetical protein [Providencia phage PSTCR5]